jgi:hypothetical protein
LIDGDPDLVQDAITRSGIEVLSVLPVLKVDRRPFIEKHDVIPTADYPQTPEMAVT